MCLHAVDITDVCSPPCRAVNMRPLREHCQRTKRITGHCSRMPATFIYTLDMHGHFTTVNKTGERILGYARDELVRIKLADIMSPESLTHSLQMRITQEAGSAWATYEIELITKDHRRVPLEVSTQLIYRGGQAV